MWKCLLKRKGLLPCQHAVTVHTLNSLAPPPPPATKRMMRKRSLCVLRCDAVVISRDANSSLGVHVILKLPAAGS